MRNGHKGRMACGILELMLGVGLILYICLADRQRIGLAAVAAVVVTAGQKQVLMEKRMQEAMEAAKAEKETIRLPITGNGDDDVFVSVNGYKYLIQRGKEVEVPCFVAEVLRNSENQKAATYRMMEEMQKKAEDGKGRFL